MTGKSIDSAIPSPVMSRPSARLAEEPPHEPAPEDEINLLELLNVLLKRWRVVTGLPLLAALLTAGISLLVPATFTATATFVPEASSQGRLPAALALAGQLGISLGSEAVSQSPRFYAEVARSRELLERILLTQYLDPRNKRSLGDSTTLLRILNVGGRDVADSLNNGVKTLNKLLSVKVNDQTNIVRLSVEARYPALAARVANRFVEYLNDFNTKTRQSQARERRKFVEERLAQAGRDLGRTEEELKTFLEGNRSWQQSPQLVFEEGRLRRQVDIRQEGYLTLMREYETARIQEVNDTPVITVIDPAVAPPERSKPKRKVLVFSAFTLGGVAGVFWAFALEHMDRMRREEEDKYREFRGLLQRVRREIGQALRPNVGRDRT